MRILLTIAVLLCGCGKTSVEPKVDWAKMLENDLAEVQSIINENHPGSVDEENPDFGEWFAKGASSLPEVNDVYSYTYALLAYVNGFRDGHLSINFHNERDVREWPGFIAAWRRESLRVYYSEEGGPAVGGAIESCDGAKSKALIDERVFRYMYNPEIPGHWARAATRAFIDRGNPFSERPQRCVIELNGERNEIELNWRPFDWAEIEEQYLEAAILRRPAAKFSYVADDVAWFSAPGFNPDDEQRVIYNEAIAALAEIQDPSVMIVIDLRGNGGGASMWAARIAGAIWGDLESAAGGNRVDWRASDGNIEYWSTIPDYLTEQFGEGHPSLGWANGVLQGMREANKRGEALWRQPVEEDAESSIDTARNTAAFAGQVIVLTDTYCASSCLDGMDILISYDNVTHVGAPTSADTQYMEVRTVELASGQASVTIPMKVYRSRHRPEGGYYTPEIPFDGFVWSDSAIEAWVLSLKKN